MKASGYEGAVLKRLGMRVQVQVDDNGQVVKKWFMVTDCEKILW